jgi:hypothetical protein
LPLRVTIADHCLWSYGPWELKSSQPLLAGSVGGKTTTYHLIHSPASHVGFTKWVSTSPAMGRDYGDATARIVPRGLAAQRMIVVLGTASILNGNSNLGVTIS